MCSLTSCTASSANRQPVLFESTNLQRGMRVAVFTDIMEIEKCRENTAAICDKLLPKRDLRLLKESLGQAMVCEAHA